LYIYLFFKGNYTLPSREPNGSPIPTGKSTKELHFDKIPKSPPESIEKKIPIRTSSVDNLYAQQQQQQQQQRQQEKDKEREKERERLHREREREKAAAQVSSKKKVEQRI